LISTVGWREERLVVAGDESLIGSIGVIIIATRGTKGPGEVLLKIRGGSEAYLAYSAEPIPRGSTVLVINNRGTRSVDVSAWIDPLQPLPDDVV
jgi:membrane-bound ClpP family serine protease